MQPSIAHHAIALLTILSTSVAPAAPSATVASQIVATQEIATSSATPSLEEQLKVAFDEVGVHGEIAKENPIHNVATQSAPVPPPPATFSDAQITFLGNCESGMTASRNSGNGYYGAFQFSMGTWNRMETGYERADLAPLEVQIAAVQKLLSHSSIYSQFPACAAKMHVQGLL